MLSIRNFFLSLLTILSFSIIISACNNTAKGNPIDGKRWYRMHNCTACHGENGNDGGAADIKNLTMNFGSFVKKLRTDDAQTMPYFSEEKISKNDAADIYAYLKK